VLPLPVMNRSTLLVLVLGGPMSSADPLRTAILGRTAQDGRATLAARRPASTP
jgi:hypothetical protein